ncbi:hypothetical protein ACM66B_003207 [Microbotryomycetes sp. NB124-2]
MTTVNSKGTTVHEALTRGFNDATLLERTYGSVNADRLRTGILGGLGQTRSSLEMVAKCLNHNHIYHDIFFDDRGLHNHAAHHLLASFSLGAGPAAIAAAYETSLQGRTRTMPKLGAEIDRDNWQKFVGQNKRYPAYLAFFHKEIESHGALATVEQYVFSGKAKMLDRLVSGAIHPFIHTGYGIEFGSDAIVAEGLAQCAVHSTQASALFPSDWPPRSPPSSSPTTRPAFVDSISSTLSERRAPATDGTINGFDLLNEMLQDDELAPGVANDLDSNPAFGTTLERKGDLIKKYCERWSLSNSSGNSNDVVPDWNKVVHKTEDLFWLATVIYGAATRPGYKPKLDFFTQVLHIVNQSTYILPN